MKVDAAGKPVDIGRSATRIKEIADFDKKLGPLFKKVGPKAWRKIGDKIKSLKITSSVFVEDAIHHFLRIALVEPDILGKSERFFFDYGLSSRELGVLIADDVLSKAHPKISMAKKMDLLPPPTGRGNKEPTNKTRVSIVVLGKNGSRLISYLKKKGISVPTYKKFQRSKYWGE